MKNQILAIGVARISFLLENPFLLEFFFSNICHTQRPYQKKSNKVQRLSVVTEISISTKIDNILLGTRVNMLIIGTVPFIGTLQL